MNLFVSIKNGCNKREEFAIMKLWKIAYKAKIFYKYYRNVTKKLQKIYILETCTFFIDFKIEKWLNKIEGRNM